ncbi:MAG: acyl-CoA dehydrogenase [Actinobacteria bacterium]|nr:acyl-CoA dehydrogenase [Actinomycetota bacterium]
MEVGVALAGLPIDERRMILDLISQLRGRMLTPEAIRRFDEEEIFPERDIREMLGPDIGLQLLFLPKEYGGLAGGARDMAAVCEELSKICLGVATAILAVHLGTDPLLIGATEAQKEKWLARVANGDIVAYAVTEPEAGSNLSNLKTTATPVVDEKGRITGYRITGTKQFISNGGYADFLTVLAHTPDGPSFFVVEKTMPGFKAGKPEKKHGIRSSNTAPLTFDDVLVPAENLVGEIPGQGMNQANAVFGYTRLMVAAMALGAGFAALDKVIPYAKERVQFGSPLIEKQGYTHRLILPFVARLEAARAYVEQVAERLDSGEANLEVEGSLAKLFATEVANDCADAAIQALGGYGYVKEYDVERIKRDVKITTIYEGTSEIQQLIVSTNRWRTSVSSKGGFYDALAEEMDGLHRHHPDLKADTVAAVFRLLNRLFAAVHERKATRQQHVMFELATLTSMAEPAAALVSKTAAATVDPRELERLRLCARVNVALCAQSALIIANEILHGSGKWSASEAQELWDSVGLDSGGSQSGLIPDMDTLRTLL